MSAQGSDGAEWGRCGSVCAVIAVVGEVLIDIIRRPGEAPVEAIGGGPFNTARAAARLGAEVTFVCPVSTDARGDRVIRALADDGIRLGIDQRSQRPTALGYATIDEHGHATYEFVLEDTSLVDITRACALSAVADASAVHLGTLSLALAGMAEVAAEVADALSPEQLLMADPNCRPAFLDGNALFQRVWPAVAARADVLKISDDDLRYLHGDDEAVALTALRDSTDALLLITRGAAGVTVIAGSEVRQVPAPSIDVVDTVGAGDTFSGAFLARWQHRGLGPAHLTDVDAVCEAVSFAATAAAITCTRVGAAPPNLEDMAVFG